jgi:uracil-DNA glycosylase family 4
MPRIVLGEGPTPCDFMVIGEAPGATEERLGKPFVGKAGERLDEALEAAGHTRAEVYITNVYKSRPPNNRDPNMKELNDHLDYLRQEFREVTPSRMLLLGKVAKEFIAPIIYYRGRWWRSPGLIDVLYTWHPAATLYNPKLKEGFFGHIQEFFDGEHLPGS